MWTLRGTAIVVFFLWLFLDGAVVFRRKSAKAENRDRFSLRIIILGGMMSWCAGICLAYTPYGVIHPTVVVQIAGLLVMGTGILVRSIAVAQLGRFHTPNVAVFADHRVVDIGLYRYIRHPSYLGALIAILGWSLALGNWFSLLVVMSISVMMYLYRIHEEEAVLSSVLGETYASYRQRTKRLIPGIY
jgi:protein-S-isoprenylcysteine O-methyltransferase Ste14